MQQRVRQIVESNSLLAMLSRFSLVGVSATLVYLFVSNILIYLLGTEATAASVVAYLAGMAVSFLGQSRFTFQVPKRTRTHLVRFIVLSAVGLAVSYASVALAVRVFAIPAFWGTLTTAIAIPLISFVVMKAWVFERQDG